MAVLEKSISNNMEKRHLIICCHLEDSLNGSVLKPLFYNLQSCIHERLQKTVSTFLKHHPFI